MVSGVACGETAYYGESSNSYPTDDMVGLYPGIAGNSMASGVAHDKNLKAAGFSAKDLKAVNFSTTDLKAKRLQRKI